MAKKPAKKSSAAGGKKTSKKPSAQGGKKSAKKVAKKSVKKVTKKAPKKASAAGGKKPAATPTAPKSNTINPYLTFAGNCEEAFNFYKSVFGGNFTYIGRFKEMPPQEGKTMSEEEGNKIMHVSLPISIETALMGSDSSDEYGHANIIGNNFSISINAKSENDANRLYDGLSAEGKPFMPMSKTFWGSYFGMLTDKFGITWMISFG